MPKTQTQLLLLTLAIPPGIAVALHAYIGSFTRLIADDYCTLYFTNRLGVLKTAWYWYLNFAGVYARSLINKILLLVGPNNMSVIVPGVLILWVAVTAWVFYLLLQKEMPIKSRVWASLALSITFIYVVLLLSPQPTQSLYWWGGFSAYTAPLILGTLYLAIFLAMIKRQWNKNAFHLWNIASFLMAFGLGGISESFSPSLIVIIAFSIGWGLITKKLNGEHPAVWFFGAGLLGSTLALIIMVAAPGNAVRMSYFAPHPSIIDIVQISIGGYADFLMTLLKEPQKWTGMLGAFFGSMLLGINSSSENPPKNWAPPSILTLGIFFAFLCFPPAVYGTSEPPPNRVLIISSFMLALGLMASGFVSGKWLSFRISENFIRTTRWGIILATIMLICFSTRITSRNLYINRNVFIEFAEKWDQVDLQILQARANGEESITIPAMDNWAGLERPNENERYWVNKCYSAYYDIQIYGPPYGK